MNAPSPAPDILALVEDDPDRQVFRVHRSVFTDPAVLALELERVFEGTWVFLALDSEVPGPHDFLTRTIGRQNVLLTRGEDGALRAFLNSCRHRGTLLCPGRAGTRKFHVCPYHGWSYDSAGRCVGVTEQAHGQYAQSFGQENLDLTPLARLDSYRGFVFASLSADVPPLRAHLGQACTLLDLVADQAPQGLEFLPGTSSYTYDGNWKLQFENGLDGYHFPTTHAAFVDIVRARGPAPPPGGAPPRVVSGSITLPRGHAMTWSIGAPGQGAENRPLPRDAALLETVRAKVGEARLSWMLRQRNLTIFPNLQIIDIQSLQLRTWQPLAPDRTRMTSHCLAPRGESAAARRFRIRQYEEFFGAGGLASSDDNVMYELSQAGLAAASAGPTHGYARGMGAAPAPGEALAALGLENARCTYSEHGLGFGDETAIQAGYREWLRLMTGAAR